MSNSIVTGYEFTQTRQREAYETWKKASTVSKSDQSNQESVDQNTTAVKKGSADQTAKDQTFEKAMNSYRDMVIDRLKNGEPKFSIGSLQISVSDWKNMMKKVDKTLEELKESDKKNSKTVKKQKDKSKLLEKDERADRVAQYVGKCMEAAKNEGQNVDQNEGQNVDQNEGQNVDQNEGQSVDLNEGQNVDQIESQSETTVVSGSSKTDIEPTDEQIQMLLEDRTV